MICNHKPLESEIVSCKTCATPWLVPCLPLRPLKIFDWNYTDCSQPVDVNHVVDASAPPITCSLVSTIYANENGTSLTGEERAKKSHEVYDGSPKPPFENNKKYNDLYGIFYSKLNCTFCLHLPERPITTLCGHNFYEVF
ncbi:unnamed protein product [Lathyrus oleraceus]